MILFITIVLFSKCVKSGDFAAVQPNLKSIFTANQMNEAVVIFEKHGISKIMIEKFCNATSEAEKITSEYIAGQLGRISRPAKLDPKERKELADKMLDGVRMWFVALEMGIPSISKFNVLAQQYNSSNLELSLRVNYFLRTTESIDNKIFNMMIDTIKASDVKKSDIGLGANEKNKLAHELVELVLTKSEEMNLNQDRLLWI